MLVLQPQIWVLMGLSILFGICDLRNRHVPVLFFVLGTVMGAAICVLNRREILSVTAAAIPGILLILLSFCSEGGIGIGDGHFFLMTGLFLEWKAVLILAAVSFLLAATVSLGVILSGFWNGRRVRKRGLPFLSFIPFALLITVCF